MVIATWCQREETPQAPLTPKEKADLQFLYDEWAHPFFISVQEYGRLLQVPDLPGLRPDPPAYAGVLVSSQGVDKKATCCAIWLGSRALGVVLLGLSGTFCKCAPAAVLQQALGVIMTFCIALMAASDVLRHAEQSLVHAGHRKVGIGGDRRLDAPNTTHLAPLQLGRRLGPLACHPQVQPLRLVQGAASCTTQ